MGNKCTRTYRNSFVCVFFVFAFIVSFGFLKEETGLLKQCKGNELISDNNQSTFSEKERSDINDDEKDAEFRMDNSIANGQHLNDIIETRPHDDLSRNEGDTNSISRLKSLLPILDYVKYPCLPGPSQSDRLRSLDRCIRTVSVQLIANNVKSVNCVKLYVGNPIPVCIHDPKIDIFVSESIVRKGTWEERLINIFREALIKVKDIVVLDIGCNIGVYTLVAAKEGKRVVSIDANIQNLRLLSKSLILGQLTENVTLIWNALSDTYTNVSLKTNPRNVAGFSVNTDHKSFTEDDVIIETILLDDIRYLFEGKPIAIKMDVESFELHILKGGMTFLKIMDVRFIQMEFAKHRGRESGRSIVTILRNQGFSPFASCLRKNKMVDTPLIDWPFDVCFIKDI